MATLLPVRLAISGRLFERKNDDFFPRAGTDIVVQASRLNAGDIVNHPLQSWTRRLDELGPNLFQQVPTSVRWKCCHQMLLGRGQDTLQANHQQIANQMGTDVLRSAPMYSCSKCDIPLQTAASISPRVFTDPYQFNDQLPMTLSVEQPESAENEQHIPEPIIYHREIRPAAGVRLFRVIERYPTH